MKLYTLEELVNLPIGTKLLISYDESDGYVEFLDTKIESKDNDYIYFDNGYDFPINDKLKVRTEFAVQDTGDYIFKVYKIN